VCVFVEDMVSYSALNNRHVARFQGLGGKYIFKGNIFVFITCSKQIFLNTTKFGGGKKCGGRCPRMAPVITSLLNDRHLMFGFEAKISAGRLHCGVPSNFLHSVSICLALTFKALRNFDKR